MSLLRAAPDLARQGTAWLATQPGDYDPSSGRGPDWGKAAPIGLLIILLLGVALFFLIKSMNKNLRRVPASFDTPTVSADAEPAGTAGSTQARVPERSRAADAGSAGSEAADTPSGRTGGEDPPASR